MAQLRKMILSSFGKDGAPRLDSVSLYALGKLLGKGAFGAAVGICGWAGWCPCRGEVVVGPAGV